jgi:hypothetical protein
VTERFGKAGFAMGEHTSSAEIENNQQDLQNCMNEAAFSICNAEDMNKGKGMQTEPDTMHTYALAQNFKES